MPRIARKGDSVRRSFSPIEVTLKWTDMSGDTDFDLAIVYTRKGSNEVGVCWGQDLGSLDGYPFMRHSGDAIGDDEEEEVLIEQPDAFDSIWVFVWDYGDSDAESGGVVGGEPTDLGAGSVTACLVDDHAIETEVPLVASSTPANCFCIATLDCTGSEIAVSNTSASGVLSGLTSTKELLGIVGADQPSFVHASIGSKGGTEPISRPSLSPQDMMGTVRTMLANHAAHQKQRGNNSQVLALVHENNVVNEAKRLGFDEQPVRNAIDSWLHKNSWDRFDELHKRCVKHISSAREGAWVKNRGIRNATKACEMLGYPDHSTKRLVDEVLEEMGCQTEADVDQEWMAGVEHYLRTNSITEKYKKKDFASMQSIVTSKGFDPDRAKSKLQTHLEGLNLKLKTGWF